MQPNEYQQLALTKMADQRAIQARMILLPAQAIQLDNGSRGIGEEAGEVLACAKRYLEYGKPLDKDRVIDECGDVLWRVAQTLNAVDCTMEEAMRRNLAKLNVRYEAGFTEQEAADEGRNRAAEAAAQLAKPVALRNCAPACPHYWDRHEIRCQLPLGHDGDHVFKVLSNMVRINVDPEVVDECVTKQHPFGKPPVEYEEPKKD